MQPLFLNVTVQGHPALAMVDTGFTFTTLDLSWIRASGLAIDARSTLSGSATGGPTTVTRGPVVDMALPSYDIHRLQTLAADFSLLKSASSSRLDMALGMDVIGMGSLELDLGAGRWRFASPGFKWAGAETATLRYTPDRYHNYIIVEIDGHSLQLGVDTGYDGGLMLSERAAALTGLFDRNRATTMASAGLGGIAISRITIPGRLKFGQTLLSGVPVEIEATGGLPSQWHMDGILGLDLLRHLHVVFDFPEGAFLYRPSEAAVPAPIRSTTGIQRITKDNSWVVLHVMANSPAAEAGWKAGDAICAVNGTKPGDSRGASWGSSPPGTVLTFQMCGGNIRTLTTRDFY